MRQYLGVLHTYLHVVELIEINNLLWEKGLCDLLWKYTNNA